MRARKLARWTGRVAAVAAFGLGVTAGAAATASASDTTSDGAATTVETPGGGFSPASVTWD